MKKLLYVVVGLTALPLMAMNNAPGAPGTPAPMAIVAYTTLTKNEIYKDIGSVKSRIQAMKRELAQGNADLDHLVNQMVAFINDIDDISKDFTVHETKLERELKPVKVELRAVIKMILQEIRDEAAGYADPSNEFTEQEIGNSLANLNGHFNTFRDLIGNEKEFEDLLNEVDDQLTAVQDAL